MSIGVQLQKVMRLDPPVTWVEKTLLDAIVELRMDVKALRTRVCVLEMEKDDTAGGGNAK